MYQREEFSDAVDVMIFFWQLFHHIGNDACEQSSACFIPVWIFAVILLPVQYVGECHYLFLVVFISGFIVGYVVEWIVADGMPGIGQIEMQDLISCISQSRRQFLT